MSGAGGFSLLELMIVLFLITVLSAIAVLSHAAMRPALDLAAATRQVAMDLQVARMRAVADDSDQRILFTEQAGEYRLQRKDGTVYADVAPPVALPSGILVLQATAVDHGISFKPRGNAATFGTVTLVNRSGETRQVIVDIAGHVRVQ